MNEEFEKTIYSRYPKLFKNVTQPDRPMDFFWGCEHEAGWFNIVDSLCKKIVRHIDWKHRDTPEDERPYPVVQQVKEKFGTLRFYIEGGDEEVFGMIKMAECMSRNVCEITGDIGSSTTPPMWAIRSPECQEKPTEDQMNRVLNFVNKIESEDPNQYDI